MHPQNKHATRNYHNQWLPDALLRMYVGCRDSLGCINRIHSEGSSIPTQNSTEVLQSIYDVLTTILLSSIGNWKDFCLNFGMELMKPCPYGYQPIWIPKNSLLTPDRSVFALAGLLLSHAHVRCCKHNVRKMWLAATMYRHIHVQTYMPDNGRTVMNISQEDMPQIMGAWCCLRNLLQTKIGCYRWTVHLHVQHTCHWATVLMHWQMKTMKTWGKISFLHG